MSENEEVENTDLSKDDQEHLDMQKSIAKTYQNILTLSESEAKAVSSVNVKKAKMTVNFLKACEENGLGGEDFVSHISDAITICKEKKDMRTIHKLLQLWHKVVFENNAELLSTIKQLSLILTQKNTMYTNIVQPEPIKELTDIEIMEQEIADRSKST